MSLASFKLQMEVGTSVAKKVMDTAELNAEAITKMIEAVDQMVPTENIIDVRA